MRTTLVLNMMLAALAWTLRNEAQAILLLGATLGILLLVCLAVWWRQDGELESRDRDWACRSGWVFIGSALVYAASAEI